MKLERKKEIKKFFKCVFLFFLCIQNEINNVWILQKEQKQKKM